MSHYQGTVIEESLEDESILKELRIVSTRVQPVTEKHKTPWVKQWTLHKVEIREDQAEYIAERFNKALDSNHKHSWYVDFKNGDFHYIIFRDKVFCMNRHDKDLYTEATQYGLSLGIPAYQLDFSVVSNVYETRAKIFTILVVIAAAALAATTTITQIIVDLPHGGSILFRAYGLSGIIDLDTAIKLLVIAAVGGFVGFLFVTRLIYKINYDNSHALRFALIRGALSAGIIMAISPIPTYSVGASTFGSFGLSWLLFITMPFYFILGAIFGLMFFPFVYMIIKKFIVKK